MERVHCGFESHSPEHDGGWRNWQTHLNVTLHALNTTKTWGYSASGNTGRSQRLIPGSIPGSSTNSPKTGEVHEA